MITDGDQRLIDRHLDHLARLGRRDRTIEARRDELRRFLTLQRVTFATATRDDVEARLRLSLSVASRRVYLAHLRGFFRWAVDEELLANDPTRRVVPPRQPRSLPRPIAEATLAQALAVAPPLERAWMLLAACAGLRACEIGPIRGEHISRSTSPTLFLPECKGGGEATVPLSQVLLAELDQWPATGWLWKSDGPYHATVVSRRVGIVLHSVGFAGGLHTLRHRFGTIAYRESRDIRLVQELMRHASPATTAGYTAFDLREGRALVDAMPIPA